MRIPHELLRSTPREVSLTAAGSFAAVMAWLLGVGGMVMSVWLFAHSMDARAADREAVVTSGDVVRLGATRGEHPKWVATYAYRVDGLTIEGRSTLGRRDRQRVAVGDVLQVRYLTGEPTRSWVDGYQPGRIPFLVSPAVLVLMGFGAGSIVLTVRRQRAMLTSGRPAVATVKDVKKVSHQHGQTYRATVEYQPVAGSTVTRKFDVSKGTGVGSELIVLYDPETPKRAVKYPLSMVRPAQW